MVLAEGILLMLVLLGLGTIALLAAFVASVWAISRARAGAPDAIKLCRRLAIFDFIVAGVAVVIPFLAPDPDIVLPSVVAAAGFASVGIAARRTSA